MSSYLEQIDALIKFHNKKVAELEIAREVVAGLFEEQKPHKKEAVPKTVPAWKEPKSEPKSEPEQPPITIRRVVNIKNLASKPDSDTKARREAMRETIVNRLKQGETVTSTDLIKEFGYSDKDHKQDVYQTLYNLKTQGVANRKEGTMQYILAEHNHQTEH